MSSREPVMTRSRSAKEAAQPTTEPKDDSKQPEMKPTRRSRRLLERRPKQDEDTGAASPAAAPLDTAAPPPLKPLRRAAAGRRASERPVKRQRCDPQLTGLWDLLPTELLDMIIEKCGPRQLACLETTCNYFRNVKKLDNVCYERLKLIPRAKGMEPNRMANESWASILFFINSQSNAAAQATALALGNTHTAALLVPTTISDGDHNLYTFGRGFHGALGHEDFEDLSNPKHLCIGYQACADHPQMEEEITPAVVTCGNSHTTCITRRGMLYTFGLGNRGELGLGVPVSGEVWCPERAFLMNKPHLRIVSIACGANHTLAISEIGTLWACGHNSKGQLGIGNLEDSVSLRPLTGALRGYRVVAAAAGQHHSMALSSDGSLFTWGSGAHGQLGHPQLHALHMMQVNAAFVVDTPRKLDSLDPFRLQPWKRVTAISSGKHHCMAVTVCGELLGFGRNKCGELGVGCEGAVWTPTPINVSWTGESSTLFRTSQVACGANHTLALVMYRGKLIPCASGENTFGELGQGDQVKRSFFVPVMSLVNAEIVTLQCGDHNCGAIGQDGSVYVWGRNDHGQLGLGDERSRWLPTQLPGFKAVHPDRTLRKNKRSLPRMRPISEDPAPEAPQAGADKVAFFFPAVSKQIKAPEKQQKQQDESEGPQTDGAAKPCYTAEPTASEGEVDSSRRPPN